MVKSEIRPVDDSTTSFLIYYQNGNLCDSMTQINGEFTGEAKHFYEDGKLEKVWEWKEGLPNGFFKSYHHSGNIKNEMFLVDSIPVGDAYEYFDDSRKQVKYWVNYSKVNGKKWSNWQLKYDSLGRVIRTTTMIDQMIGVKKITVGDSLKIIFRLKYPEYPKTKLYIGGFDDNFRIIDTSSVRNVYGSRSSVMLYVPTTKTGPQRVMGVLENYNLLDSLKSGLIRTEGKVIYWSYDYEVVPHD